jgi:hypothetical protein
LENRPTYIMVNTVVEVAILLTPLISGWQVR